MSQSYLLKFDETGVPCVKSDNSIGVGLTECLIRSVIFTNLHVVSVNADIVFLGVAMSNKKNKANY